MAAAAALLQGRCAVPRASRPEGTGVPPGLRPGAAGQLTDLGSRRVALASIKSWQRPLYARAASDNAVSLRVLKKAGFKAVGTECSFAPARKTEIEETILRKD